MGMKTNLQHLAQDYLLGPFSSLTQREGAPFISREPFNRASLFFLNPTYA
jgi:hypothetical protein